jgi:putative ABC transport system permease protein
MTDTRYALRTLRRAPGFTLVAALTLALGIGATTAIFSVVNAVLLRPLPYPDADRLVTIRGSLPDLHDLDTTSRSFEGMAIWASNLYNIGTDADTRQVQGGVVSRTLLPLLGVQPILGRNFTADDDRQETVIIGYGLWQSSFGGDPRVLGRRIDLSGTPHTVVGVAPAWFRFPGSAFQLWTPLGVLERKAPEQARDRSLRIFSGVARLGPGASLPRAQAEADAISRQLAVAYPPTNEGVTLRVQALYDRLVGNVRPALTILLATVGLLLLIACANVANLMLARTTGRGREMAIRIALGAGRGRLLRQLIVESLVLAIAGGTLGLLVAMWGIDLLPATLGPHLPRAEEIRLDGVVLAFALGATLLTGLFFGLAPALQTASEPFASLKEGARGLASGARGRRVRRAIVMVETALAVVVLVGAGLLVRSFLSLTARDAGFAPGDLYSFNVQFLKVPETSRAQVAAVLMERLAALPGVETAGAATGLPVVTPQRGTRFAVEGRTLTAEQDGAYFIAATPGYFEALRTRVVQGRAIDGRDVAGGAPVVVVNRLLASQLFPDGDAVGRRLRLVNPEQSDAWRTIVGVVGDVRYRGLEEETQPTLYTAFAQTPFMWLYVMVRTPVVSESMVRSLREATSSAHPSLTAAGARPMRDVLAETVAQPRFNMLLVSSFAVLALLLSAIGIYGVVAYSVARRTQEIGIRMALGAARIDVLRMVLAEGIAMATAGVMLGLAACAVMTRLMSGLLVGIAPRDPVAFAAGAVLLLAVAIVASYLPARRATRVEPVTALRGE